MSQTNKATEAVKVNELLHYTHYNSLYVLLNLRTGPKGYKNFRYRSEEEATIWASRIGDFTSKNSLFFYSLLDEVRETADFFKDKAGKNSRDVDVATLFSQSIRVAIYSHLAFELIGEEMLRALIIQKDGGEVLFELFKEGHELANIGKKEIFWDSTSSGKNLEDFLYGVVTLFSSSNFMREQEKFSKNLPLKLKIIEGTGILNNYFSLKDNLKKELIGVVVNKKENTHNIAFFDGYPLWVNSHGDSSFFSFIFKDLFDRKTVNYIELLEYIRVYLLSDSYSKKNIRDSSLVHVVKMLLNRHGAAGFSDEDKKELSYLLLSGGSVERLRSFFAYSNNMKLIKNSRGVIHKIIDKEAVQIIGEIENQKSEGVPAEEAIKKGIKLFFINVFEKIEEFFTGEARLTYEDLSEEHMLNLSRMISSIINERIPDTLKVGRLREENEYC